MNWRAETREKRSAGIEGGRIWQQREATNLFDEGVGVLPDVSGAVGEKTVGVELEVELESIDPKSSLLESTFRELLGEGLKEGKVSALN